MSPESDPQVQGRAFPPGHSLETPATLTREDDMFVLRDSGGEELRRLPRYDLRYEAPLGQLERQVTFRDGSIFLTDDSDGLDTLLGEGAGHVLHRSERFSRRLIFVVAAAILGIALIWRFGLPVLVEVAVWATPPAMLPQIDAGTMQSFDTLLNDDTTLSAEEQAEITDIFETLAAELPPPAPGINRQLLFRDSRLGPNAFALPGGTVLVTDDLVNLMGDDADALAGVLAHELIHVELQHGLRNLYRSLAIYVVVAMIAGDTGAVLDEILLEGNALLSLSGSRNAEREADAGAVPLTAAAGYDPAGLARFFILMRDEFGEGGGYMSTHPGSKERADEILRQIREGGL